MPSRDRARCRRKVERKRPTSRPSAYAQRQNQAQAPSSKTERIVLVNPSASVQPRDRAHYRGELERVTVPRLNASAPPFKIAPHSQ